MVATAAAAAVARKVIELALPSASLACLAGSFVITRTSTHHTPRRTPILALEGLLGVSYLATGLATVIEVVLDRRWGAGAPFVLAYALASLALWGGVASTSEWKHEWDKWWVKAVVSLSLAGESVLLALHIRMVAHRHTGPFELAALSLLATRLLLLAPLAALLAFPRPASDSKASSASAPLLSSIANGHAEAYGTFPNSTLPSAAPSTPVSADSAEPIKKADEAAQSWGGFFRRLYSLGLIDRLWPKESYRLQLLCILCVGIVLVTRGVNAFAPLSLGRVIDALTSGESPWLWIAAYVIARFLSGSGGLSALQNVTWTPVEQYSDAKMQTLCFDHLLDLSLAWQTKRKTGETMRTLDRGYALTNLLQIVLFNITPIILDISIALVVFFKLFGPALAVVVCVVMVSYVTVSVLLTTYRTQLRRQMNERDSAIRAILTDTLMSYETVKYFTAEQRESKRYRQAVADYQKSEYKVTMSLSLLNFVQASIMSLGLLVGSALVANDVVKGRISPSAFIVFNSYLAQLYGPLGWLGGLYRQLNQLMVDSEKLLKLLSEEVEVKDPEGATELVVSDGEIVFDDVHFSYDDRRPALSGISFTVPKGHKVGLVGETGSGKSTILRLLYRFYNLQSGAIRIDGQDIATVTQNSLRRNIGVVPQDTALLNESIGYNIGYGKEGATQEEIVAAAKAAQFHTRIESFPDGYDTKVGERGVRLSGGEKQRVSLARAMLKGSPIMILDEATSALDTHTEREIQAALVKLQQGRTSISIAHRLSTIVNVDTIIVLGEGKIVEQGTFEELVAAKGAFAKLWQKQISSEVELAAMAESDQPEQKE